MTARHEQSVARFDVLYRATRADILSYLLRRATSPEDAADAVAETYLIAWEKLDSIPSGEQARLWLFGVARNVLLRAVWIAASATTHWWTESRPSCGPQQRPNPGMNPRRRGCEPHWDRYRPSIVRS